MEEQSQHELVIDNRIEQGILAFIRKLPEKSDLLYRFFLQGDFYSTYAEDATVIASEYYRTTAVLKSIGNTPCLAIRKMMYESIIRDLLLIKRYRVEVYAKTDASRSSTSTGGCAFPASSSPVWALYKKGSPGNLLDFEEDLFKNNEIVDSVTIGALSLGISDKGTFTVGCGFVDTVNLQIGVCQFTDKESFSNLEAFIIQQGFKECLVYFTKSDANLNSILTLLKRNAILVTDRPKKEFFAEPAQLNQDLELLLNKDALATLKFLNLNSSYDYAMQGLSALLAYLKLTHDFSLHEKFTLATRSLDHYMKLSISAFNAMNIFPTTDPGAIPSGLVSNAAHNSGVSSTFNSETNACVHEGSSGFSHHTIFGLLNHTNTPQGQRMLSCWCKQPLLDKKILEERQNIVEILVNESSLRYNLKEYFLSRFPDLNRIMKALLRGKGSLLNCVKIKSALMKIPRLIAILSDYQGHNAHLLSDLFVAPMQLLQQDLEKLSQLLETTIYYDEETRTAKINPSFNEDLHEISQQMAVLDTKIQQDFLKTARHLGLVAEKTLKREHSSTLMWHYRVSRKDENILRNNVNKTDILETQKNGVKFTTDVLRGVNHACRTLDAEYAQKQESISKEVINLVCGYATPLEVLLNTSALIDTYCSLATFASHPQYTFVKPILYDMGTGHFKAKQVRHPCLERQKHIQFVPNDLDLDRNTSRFQLITGPNMGGKSTYIRQVGILCFLAQIGSFVPCEEAHLPIVDSILARIGAGDNQLKGASTFMVEMLETSHILSTATEHSLVLIDELGRGTSTYDGFGLAYAISDFLINQVKAYCLFATHFHELTYLESTHPSVKNLQMLVSEDASSFKLLYKVSPGACGKSFGIHVAKLAQFPASVIDIAQAKLNELDTFDFDQKEQGSAMAMLSSKRQKLNHNENQDHLQRLNKVVDFLTYFGQIELPTPTDKELSPHEIETLLCTIEQRLPNNC